MAEVMNESEHVWNHKQRIVLFLSAMRHFRDELNDAGIRVEYTRLDERKKTETFSERLGIDLRRLRPRTVRAIRPGAWRILDMLEQRCAAENIPLELSEDLHFYTTPEDFRNHAENRKTLRMEYFYREQRKRFDVLMNAGKPVGGDWNYDQQNRESFGRKGPPSPGAGPEVKPDRITEEVMELVEKQFGTHPGTLDTFAWPVTRKQAKDALQDFIRNRLPNFGRFQDAMWMDEPWLYHSWISSSLNLKLLNPREAVDAAETAGRNGTVPLAAAEGFIRQILGWREYVRGIYWTRMPDYLELNTLEANEPLPDFYWTGKTELNCLRQVIGQTLKNGYAHHIQRLMVTGLYALLLGVDPKRVHEWYLAVYVDAVEWVELPNTLGMSQYGDGGLMASKPYIATGSYINRMSNYCSGCPKNPKEKAGETACPFTTLYWDFLIHHQDTLKNNRRMTLQLRNLEKLNSGERSAVSKAAAAIRKQPAGN